MDSYLIYSRASNAYLYKLCSSIAPVRTKLLLDTIDIDVGIGELLKLCYKVIAPGTRFYTNKNIKNPFNDCTDSVDIVVIKSSVISTGFVAHKNYLLNKVHNETTTSPPCYLSVAKDWLFAKNRYGDCCEPELRADKYGNINRIYLKIYDYSCFVEMFLCISMFLENLKLRVEGQ